MRLVALLAAFLGGLPAAALADARADAAARAPRLDAFDSCQQLVRFARRNVLRSTTRRDIPVRALPAPVAALDPALGAPAEGGSPTPEAQRDEAAEQQQSGTNVQEAGVDEPDLVKSDGSRVFTIVAGSLLAIDVTGEQPRLVGSLPLDGSGHELLLHGGRALVVATAGAPAPAPTESTTAPEPARSAVSLTEVDVSNPAAMRVARTLIVDGSYVSARLTGATARVVLSSPPELVPAAAPPGETRDGSREQSAAIRRARLRSFIPEAVLRSRVSGRTYRRGLVGCSAVRRTASYSGVDLLTVLTIDLDKGLPTSIADAVMADAETVYASPTSLYVASQRWLPSGGRATAHSPLRHPRSRSRDRVPGERRASPATCSTSSRCPSTGGALRVATTEEPPWGATADRPRARASSPCCRARGPPRARSGASAASGAASRSTRVRFVGDIGYVVTFRQIDPLYTIDLSQPASPRVAGRAEDPRLLRLPASARPTACCSASGRTPPSHGRRLGAQVSLFDVSDLAVAAPPAPARARARLASRRSSSTTTRSCTGRPRGWPWSPCACSSARARPGPPSQGVIGLRVGRADWESRRSGASPTIRGSDRARPPLARRPRPALHRVGRRDRREPARHPREPRLLPFPASAESPGRG